MKKFSSVFVIVLAMLFTASVVFGQQVQLRGSGMLYKPNGAAITGSDEARMDSVDWDSGSGFDVQAIYWFKDSPWGIGASIGKATWEVDKYSKGTYADLNEVEGDADLTIPGISAFRKIPLENILDNKLKANLEAGLRFVSVDSNIEGWYHQRITSSVTLHEVQEFEIDDCIIAVLAIDAEYKLGDNFGAFAQVGGQLDLEKGEVTNSGVTFDDIKAGETELQALFAKIGLVYSF